MEDVVWKAFLLRCACRTIVARVARTPSRVRASRASHGLVFELSCIIPLVHWLPLLRWSDAQVCALSRFRETPWHCVAAAMLTLFSFSPLAANDVVLRFLGPHCPSSSFALHVEVPERFYSRLFWRGPACL